MPRDDSRTPPCPPPAAPAGDAAPEALEAALDGVRYALLRQNGTGWRLGSLSPLWREEAAGLGAAPDAAALDALAARGVWLAPDSAAPPLAVMCCGLGSVWPGMGRELYDNFPAAREAMDRVAALADWDVLGLMDETDVEAISHSRRQIPYLFLLEYAQWSQFASLGLAPALFCGHSLGELIGLSLAGIYGLEEAWYILETRAGHMAELEARATRDTGMMAVHAESGVIDETLANWPDIYVSNRNTPRQFILSGPRQSLQAARAALRKRRIPSMLLNVSLAFHHPDMRILRDLSQRRLGALEMRAPRVPMLSGITAGHYPHDQPSICRYITDLDENTVIWTDCVDAMWRRDGIRHFLELGPQDTLCGLVADCEPRALCLSAGRKGNEVAAMRAACARLHALGHLAFPRIRRLGAARRAADPAPEGAAPDAPGAPAAPVAVPDAPVETFFGQDAERAARILDLVAEACGRPRAALRPEHDLRYDLALRSSRFPLLLQEAERRLGVRVEFEALLQVATVGDLVRVLLGRAGGKAADGQQGRPQAARRNVLFPPLRCFAPPEDSAPASVSGGVSHGRPTLLPLDPGGTGPGVKPGGVYALCVLDAELLPELWSGLAPFSATLAVPRARMEACAPLARAGSRLLPLEPDAEGGPEALIAALDALFATEGRLDGIFLVPPPATLATDATPPAADALGAACGAWRARHAESGTWFACLRRWRGTPSQAAAVLAGEAEISAPESAWMRGMAAMGAAPVLALLDDGRRLGRDALGDMCAAELFRGGGRPALLALPEAEAAGATPPARPAPARDPAPLEDRPELFAPVYPEPWAGSLPPLPPENGLFQGGCQFSRFADPALAEHGGWAPPGPGSGGAVAWLPFSRALLALLQGARLLLPWLTVTGFSDVRFFAPPLLPPGITREGRVTARAQPWIMHDGAMTRMCRVALSVRELAANGRHTDTFAPVAEGMALLASGPREAPPLAPLPGGECREAGADLALEPLYACLGFGPAWQLVSRLRPARRGAEGDVLAVHRGTLETGMPVPGMPGAADASGTGGARPVAPRADWGYTDALRLTAAAMESALLILEQEGGAPAAGHPEGPSAGSPAWRCGGLGFLRFGAVSRNGAPADGRGTPLGGTFDLEVRRTWDDGNRVRFDTQVSGADGAVPLTLHHLEFERPDGAR